MRSGAGIHAQQDVALRAEHLEGFQLREHPLKRLGRMSLRSPQGQVPSQDWPGHRTTTDPRY